MLSFGRQYAGPLNAEALACVLDAGVRGFDLVVIDLVRSIDAIATIALGRATSAYVVVPNSVRAASAAASLLPALDFGGPLTLLMRKAPRGLTASDMQRALGQGFFTTLPEDAAIAASAEQGEIPGPRTPFSRACLEALQSVVTQLSVA